MIFFLCASCIAPCRIGERLDLIPGSRLWQIHVFHAHQTLHECALDAKLRHIVFRVSTPSWPIISCWMTSKLVYPLKGAAKGASWQLATLASSTAAERPQADCWHLEGGARSSTTSSLSTMHSSSLSVSMRWRRWRIQQSINGSDWGDFSGINLSHFLRNFDFSLHLKTHLYFVRTPYCGQISPMHFWWTLCKNTTT